MFSVGNTHLVSPAQSLNLIADGWRPTLTKNMQSRWPKLCTLIKELWHTDPDQRPGAGEVIKKLARFVDEDIHHTGEDEFLARTCDLDATFMSCNLDFEENENVWARREDLEEENCGVKVSRDLYILKVLDLDYRCNHTLGVLGRFLLSAPLEQCQKRTSSSRFCCPRRIQPMQWLYIVTGVRGMQVEARDRECTRYVCSYLIFPSPQICFFSKNRLT